MGSDKCLACGLTSLRHVMDLGHQKPVNNLGPGTENQRLPLGLMACSGCGHAQLTHFAEPELLYGDYLYASSTSQTLSGYMDWLADVIHEFLKSMGWMDLLILEIASNDGLFLGKLGERKLSAMGIDPARRMVERSVSLGHQSLIGYWPDDSNLLPARSFSLVVGQNVLAHTPRPLEMLIEARARLEPGGIALFQTSQAFMVENGEFDTVYHEHYSFFCEDSARILGDRAGFSSYGVAYSSIHGGSALHYFSDDSESIVEFQKAISSQGNQWLLDPTVLPISVQTRSESDWNYFSEVAHQKIFKVQDTILEWKSNGRRVIAVGAAAKGITFLRMAMVPIDVILDEASDKVGMFVDGLGLKIQSFESFVGSGDDVYIFTAWNFVGELAAKLVRRGVNNSSPALVYFPTVKVMPLSEFL